jgi:2-polyprenyl-3-methyl-5-hydroxy-6-metoxy-1,4-benzoquinol methylase
MSEHKCPVCGASKNIFALCEVNGFSIYGCKSCGADHVHPMPKDDTLKAYYDREEWFEGGEAGGYQNYDQQTAWSVDAVKPILESYGDTKGLSILDVGCGYGTHLDLAASLGWKCFGVEVSDHARQTAQKRLGNKAYVVESVADLIPHEFDLILILDVIEHLPSPYTLFYSLFSIGAITPKTRIVISTPNAGTHEARTTPADWSYRHPPSHLVYYSADSLKFLLEKLHFSDINVQGAHPLPRDAFATTDLAGYGGLWATAKGSNFAEFMRERYVPGTWSKIAEYEHMPRYALARTLATNKQVLDFGCGTGYGSAMLAEVAASVTGLDIDAVAQNWASTSHHNPVLRFHLCDDLGATLAPKSFDLITCFEMIEHVDYATQRATIASISRLIRDNGTLLISTPNPEVTKLYGENLYHLREMTETEFLEILSEHFPCVTLLKQKVQIGISFSKSIEDKALQELSTPTGDHGNGVAPLAFIAVCTKTQSPENQPVISFDEDTDFILEFMKKETKLHQLRFDAYRLAEQVNLLETTRVNEISAYIAQSEEFARQVSALQNESRTAQAHIAHQSNQIEDLSLQIRFFQNESNDAKIQIANQSHVIADYVAQSEEYSRQVSSLQKASGDAQDHIAFQANALDALKRQRDEELTSIRFLFKQLLAIIYRRTQKLFLNKPV